MSLYLMEQHEGAVAKQKASEGAPFGPEFEKGIVADVVRLEVWATTCDHEDDDYVRFKAINKDGKVIGSRDLPNY